MSNVFKALSDPTRREVLGLLKDGPLTAGTLAEGFGVSKATMSAHFAVLREAGLIEAEKDGKNIRYHLRLTVLQDALLGLSDQVGLGLEKDKGARRNAAAKTP